jgi:hypothetical protein
MTTVIRSRFDDAVRFCEVRRRPGVTGGDE